MIAAYWFYTTKGRTNKFRIAVETRSFKKEVSSPKPRKRLKRTLYVVDLIPSSKFGSLEEQILLLAQGFRDQNSLFLPLFHIPPDTECATPFSDVGLKTEGLNLSKIDLKTMLRLLSLIYRNNIELVHWNFYHPYNAYVWFLTLFAPSLEHYYTDHLSRWDSTPNLNRNAKWFIKRILSGRYKKVLCISDFILKDLKTQGIWSNLARCRYFVNTNRFRPDSNTRLNIRQYLHSENKFVVLVVAKLIIEKGVHVAIKALEALPNTVELWIAGEGNEEGRLKALCKQLLLEKKVKFLGQQKNVETYMQGADCLICPSIWGEAVGLVILEGLSCGLPVIASAVGGIPEFIRDGVNGYLVQPDDDKQLAEKIAYFHDNPEVHSNFSQQARKIAIEQFSPEARIDEYLDLYRS